MHIDEPEVTLGESVAILGEIDTSDAAQRYSIYLIGVEWPYRSERVVAATVVGGNDGPKFRFDPVPELNTRYYVRTGDLNPAPNLFSIQKTPPQQVKVFPNLLRFKVKVVAPYVIKMRFALDFPDRFAFPLGGRRIHWYLDTKRRGKVKIFRLRRTRTKVSKGNVMRGRIRTRVPRGRYRFRGAFCLNFEIGTDTGLGDVQQERCPK